MPKIDSFEKLQEAYKKYQPLLHSRKDGKTSVTTRTVLICGGTGCQSSESTVILSEFERLIAENKLQESVDVSIAGCFGFCEKGPIVKIFPENTFYVQVTPADVPEIVEQHLKSGKLVSRLLYFLQIAKTRCPAQLRPDQSGKN
jgi:NADH-quinone oxidoreductase subunit F